MRVRQVARGGVTLAAELAALLLLFRVPAPGLDWSDVGGWLDRVPPEDAIVALVRLAALATALYLLASTVLYVLATLTRVPALIRGAATLTLPGVRRLVDGAVVAALAAAPATVAFGVVPAAAEGPRVVHEYTPTAAGDTPASYVPEPAGDLAEVSYVVRPGDNLWTIAEARLSMLRAASVGELDEDDLWRYWRAVVERNAPSLASGDPDVIFAGEIVVLPAT